MKFILPKLFSISIIPLLLTAAVFFTPEPTSAQALGGFVSCSGTDCSFCQLVDMGNSILVWLVGILFVVFAVVMVIAGFGLVTSAGNPSAVSDAKSKFVNACIGLLIVLGAWLLVDTIMRGLLKGGEGEVSGVAFWSEVECYDQRPFEKAVEAAREELNYIEIDNFAGDHGYGTETATGGTGGGPSSFGGSGGSPSTGPITGVGGNCPGASPSEVVSVPGESGRKLLPQASRNFVAMREAAAADGITLRLTSAWRSQADQERIWKNKGCTPSSCRGRVAMPCSLGGNGSNHNSGVAVDISGSYRGSAIYNWLKANGGRYGFYNNLGPRDPVHWSPTGK